MIQPSETFVWRPRRIRNTPWIRGRSIRAPALVALGLTWVATVIGQPPRTRSLVFDAAKGEWVELPPPPTGTAEGDLHAIREWIREEKHRPALSAIGKFVQRYGTGHPLYPDALIARAEAQIGRGDHYKAHLTLQEFLSGYRGTPLTAEALRWEFVIAESFLRGVKRKVWGIPLLSGEDDALKILDEIATDHRDSRLAELAVKTKADYLFHNGEHASAGSEYARLAREYPQGRYQPFALRRAADAALARFGGVEYDEAALSEARERYHEYRSRDPGAAGGENVERILAGIEEMRADKEFSIGSYYERTGHLRSAVFYYESARKNFPETVAGLKATRRLELLGAVEAVR